MNLINYTVPSVNTFCPWLSFRNSPVRWTKSIIVVIELYITDRIASLLLFDFRTNIKSKTNQLHYTRLYLNWMFFRQPKKKTLTNYTMLILNLAVSLRILTYNAHRNVRTYNGIASFQLKLHIGRTSATNTIESWIQAECMPTLTTQPTTYLLLLIAPHFTYICSPDTGVRRVRTEQLLSLERVELPVASTDILYFHF
jgi:hypothetical protein